MPPPSPQLKSLGQGITFYMARDFAAAIPPLRAASGLPGIPDYAVYHLASALQQTRDYDAAITELNAYRAHPVSSSPLAGKISLLHGRVLLDKGQPSAAARALEILTKDYASLPQPEGDFALAMAYEAQGERIQSTIAHQRVYYRHPETDFAAQSALALERLRTTMGGDFPEPPPRQRLDRPAKWLALRQYARARQEYTALAATLSGAEKDIAKVGVGAATSLAGDNATASRYLKTLGVADPETDAQRLYYLAEASRKASTPAAATQAIQSLAEHYPKSPWRLKTLVSAANSWLLTNDREKATPLYRAAVEGFPADSGAAANHWKIVWDAWLGGAPGRVPLLREQIERYPADSRAGTALYFLGRIAENDARWPEARAYYERLSTQFPHYFYGVTGKQKLAESSLASALPEPAVRSWLSAVHWPARRDLTAEDPNPATLARMERARLLQAAGLPDLAESELRFGARRPNEQAERLALEMARTASSPAQALRFMKSLSNDYLALPLSNAPREYWRLLFPLPYKDELFRNAEARGLDPWSVAGLIRQESEFNPEAKSRANALGLMQLMPATGRMLGRQQGIPSLQNSMLFDPATNLRLGTEYLRQQLETWSGNWYYTLAAYNAGPRRVREWLAWGTWREPAEFVESIPFTETRDYVQAVLRNADIYRELYGPELRKSTPK